MLMRLTRKFTKSSGKLFFKDAIRKYIRLVNPFLYVKKGIVIEIIRETTIALIVFNFFFELIAGHLFSEISIYYKLLPGIFLIIPGLLEQRGNIASSFAQRIGSAVHLGIVDWSKKFNDEMIENLKAVMIMAFLNATVLAIGAYLLATLKQIPSITIIGYFLFAIITTSIAILMAPVTIIISLYFHRKGIDPDNVVIPILSSLNDIFVVCIIITVLRLMLWLSNFIPIV